MGMEERKFIKVDGVTYRLLAYPHIFSDYVYAASRENDRLYRISKPHRPASLDSYYHQITADKLRDALAKELERVEALIREKYPFVPCPVPASRRFAGEEGRDFPKPLTQHDPSIVATFATPHALADEIRKSIKGQDDAVNKISVAIFDQSVRRDDVKKENVLIIGPTGCGKTAIARAATKLIHLPFVEAKLAGLTTSGYRGFNFNELFKELKSVRSHERSSRAVMFLDEIDKICNRREGFGQGLQDELIGCLESAKIRCDGGPFGMAAAEIDTTQTLFICAGAFVGLEKIIADRLGAKQLRDGSFELTVPELYLQATSDDFQAYGMKAELFGRLPIVTSVKPLTEEDLTFILRESKDSVMAQQINLLKDSYGLRVEVEQGVYELVARAAALMGTGARGLETVTANLFTDIKYDPAPFTRDRVLGINTEMALEIIKKHHPLEKQTARGQPHVGFVQKLK